MFATVMCLVLCSSVLCVLIALVMFMFAKVVVVVCHGQVRRQVSRGSLMHELISTGSAIDTLVTSQSGVCCKRKSVSRLVVKPHSLYRCRLVLRTPYACSPAIYDNVLIVAGRECIVVFRSVSVCRFRWLSFLLTPSLERTVA